VKIAWPRVVFAAAVFLTFLTSLTLGITARLLVERGEPIREREKREKNLPAAIAVANTDAITITITKTPPPPFAEAPAEPTKEPDASPEEARPRSPQPPAGQNSAKRSPAKRAANLSAYEPRPRKAVREDYLPADDSMTSAGVAESLKDAQSGGKHDWGKGLLGDIARGAESLIEKADDSTLSASRKVLGDVASPDKATVRPGSNGVRLRITIPTQ
jgi:hypothetical protein